MKKILIADDHMVVRLGTAIILEDFFENISVDQAEDYNDVITKVSIELYDLLILDIQMPGSLFEDMIKEIKWISPDIKILIFTGSKENQALGYLKNGAEAYLNKTSEEKLIIEAVQSIFDKGYYYPQEILFDFLINETAVKKCSGRPMDFLSVREIEIYNHLIKGYGILEISNILNIHMSTVSTHKKRILTKLKVGSVAEMVHLHNKYYP